MNCSRRGVEDKMIVDIGREITEQNEALPPK
jgi:hypothetical protein